jgi:hypothetical protein
VGDLVLDLMMREGKMFVGMIHKLDYQLGKMTHCMADESKIHVVSIVGAGTKVF